MRQKQKQSTYNKLTNLYENSFVICGGKLFNSLPKEIRNSEYQVEDSTLFFKKALDEFLRGILDEPNAIPDYSKRIGTVNQSLQKRTAQQQ